MAAELGLEPSVLRRWRSLANGVGQAASVVRPGGAAVAASAEQPESRHLRRKLERAQMEHDILKKAWWVQPVAATRLGLRCSGRVYDGAHGSAWLVAEQKRELWTRWKDSRSLSDIGRALGKHAASVFGVLAAKGGIAPPDKTRSQASLTAQEREGISRGLAAGLLFRRIAARLGRALSTVSREVGRNDGRACYRAAGADERAWAQAARPKPCLLAVNKPLQALVAEKLQVQWSPQQVSGWLKAEHASETCQ